MAGRSLARLLAAGLAATSCGVAAAWPDGPADGSASRPTVAEARERARLLHGTIHDTLQLVHARYYREDERLPIPASSLEDLFRSVAGRSGVELRWLVVEGRAMNVEHLPREGFETAAAEALAAGKGEHEAVADGRYRHAGAITLKAECLKCHLPGRSSNASRTAGLVIAIPVAEP
jgi:hypothetical protein